MKLIYAGLALTSFVILLFSFNKKDKTKQKEENGAGKAISPESKISASEASPAEIRKQVINSPMK